MTKQAATQTDSPLLGYVLKGPDNGSYLFPDTTSTAFCKNCHSLLDDSYLPPTIPMGKNLDVSATYDNRLIVSERFAEHCQEIWPAGLVLRKLPGRQRNYYVLSSNRVVTFDAKRRKTRFEDKCPVCGQFAVVVGATPVILRNEENPLPEGFSRTDLAFGSAEGKSPLVLLGIETGRELEQHRFTGLDLTKVARAPEAAL